MSRLASGPAIEICILAGGLSTRMGRDKARLRIHGRSLLSIVRAVAASLKIPVRVIRRDKVPRCGPLGGIVTGLLTTRAGAVLFLACDMPLIRPVLLRRIIRASWGGERAVFAAHSGRVGFPLLLPVPALACVERRLARGELPIHRLAAALKPVLLSLPSGSRQLCNVNTPADALEVKRWLKAEARA